MLATHCPRPGRWTPPKHRRCPRGWPSAANRTTIGSCWVLVNELDAGKLDWVRSWPAGRPAKDGLARIAGADGGHDDAGNSCYQTAAHPAFVQVEAARRRFRGQYLRRLKGLAEHAGQAGSGRRGRPLPGRQEAQRMRSANQNWSRCAAHTANAYGSVGIHPRRSVGRSELGSREMGSLMVTTTMRWRSDDLGTGHGVAEPERTAVAVGLRSTRTPWPGLAQCCMPSRGTSPPGQAA
jgi:hypothetical protein